ncbi:MAG: PEGA domain-containing protein [Vicinamibacterales bacterium]
MHDVEPQRDEEPPPQRASSSSDSDRGITAGILVVGLLGGFVGGFLSGQRLAPPPPPRVTDVPRPAQDVSPAPPAVITESPVTEVPDNPVAPTLPGPSGEPGQARPTTTRTQPDAPRTPSRGLLSGAATPSAQAKPAMLELASRPAGATVYLDDVRVGVTPVTINDVRLGTRRVRIELTGHRPWITSVEVEAGAHLRLGASLE